MNFHQSLLLPVQIFVTVFSICPWPVDWHSLFIGQPLGHVWPLDLRKNSDPDLLVKDPNLSNWKMSKCSVTFRLHPFPRRLFLMWE